MHSPGNAKAALCSGAFDEGALRARVEAARLGLPGGRADLALVFMTPGLLPQAREIIEIIQVHGRATLLVGGTGSGVLGHDEEVEEGLALSFALFQLPGALLKPTRFTHADIEAASGLDWWHRHTGVDNEQCRGWLTFLDPYTVDAEKWLRQWNDAYPRIPTVGGLTGGAPESQETHLFLNQDVFSDGGVGVAVAGSYALEAIVSQGCKPIGRPWTITAADQNVIRRIGNLPALNVLQETFEGLPAAEKERAGGNIFVGLAVNEYQEEHRRGDFLVRNLLAADPNTGVVSVGARVRVGQTLQFQFRDAHAATDDFAELLGRTRERLGERRVQAACLCCCAGRGQRLFGHPHHDLHLVREKLGPELPIAGLFCNGEIGPVGERTFLHGYTASLALFVSDDRS